MVLTFFRIDRFAYFFFSGRFSIFAGRRFSREIRKTRSRVPRKYRKSHTKPALIILVPPKRPTAMNRGAWPTIETRCMMGFLISYIHNGRKKKTFKNKKRIQLESVVYAETQKAARRLSIKRHARRRRRSRCRLRGMF